MSSWTISLQGPILATVSAPSTQPPKSAIATPIAGAARTRQTLTAPALPEGGGDDAALVARLREGDSATFSALVRRYHGTMMRIASGYVSSQAVAEDVVQEAWMGALKGLARFEGRSSFRGWLFSILINRAKTRGQQEHRTVPFSALGQADEEESIGSLADRFTRRGKWAKPPSDWGASTPEELLMRRQLGRQLESAINQLPDRHRIVVTLRDVEGLNSSEVCALLDISEANQRVILHRARTRMREVIAAAATAQEAKLP